MRAAAAALVAVFVLVAAGCGSEDVGTGSTGAATLLKPGALVYWEAVSDPDSEQWTQVEELLRRFPDGEKWIRELRQEFESDTEVTWAEVKTALGDDAVLAVYPPAGGDEPLVVGMTNPDDPQKTIALIKRADRTEGDEPSVTRVVDGWVAVSDSEAALDAALKGDSGRALADDAGFESALEDLPEDALTRVYVDPAAAVEAVRDLDPQGRSALRMFGFDKLDFAGGWATAKDEGAELAFTLRGEGADRLLGTGDPYTSALLDRVPADAFAFTSFRGDAAREQFEQFSDNPLYRMGIEEFERELGVTVDELVALFEGEVVFYARPGSPIPELTLLLDSDDAEAARESAERLLRKLAQRAGLQVTEEGDVTTVAVGGFSINLGTVGGAVVLTSAKSAIADLAEEGDGLAENDRFSSAIEDAGVPDEYTGLAYVDLSEAIELAMNYAQSSGETVPPDVSRNLEPLRSLVTYGDEEGNLSTSLAFLEIE